MKDLKTKRESKKAPTVNRRRNSSDIFFGADNFQFSKTDDFLSIQRKAACACGGGCPACQSSNSGLLVSHPNDASEIEADATADKVMRMQTSEQPADFSSTKNSIQKKEIRSNSSFAAPSIVHDVINSSGGKSLDESTRLFMESRFNYDFSNVKIHDNPIAAKSADSINALAYTLGNDIVFNSGQYNPNSDSGKRLLAHELTHVLQQNKNNSSLIQRHICTLPRSTATLSSTRLTPAELARRISEVRRVIASSSATYPLASANLQHWLDNTGATRVIPLSEYNFANIGSGIPAHLLNVHRQHISSGIRNRMNAAHAQSLIPIGTVRNIEWMDSMRAQLFTRSGFTYTPTAPLERGLSIALGGFTVKSVVTVRATTLHTVEVVNWRVQICDRYDWIVGGQALIMIPPGIALPPIPQGAGTVINLFGNRIVRFNDRWMAEIEASGGARAYDIFSEEFAASMPVTAPFSV